MVVTSFQTLASPVLVNGWDVEKEAVSDALMVPHSAPAPGSLWVVAPAKPSDTRTSSILQKSGWRLITYLARDGFLVQAPETAAGASVSALFSPETIRFATLLRADWKIDPAFRATRAGALAPARRIPVVIWSVGGSPDLGRAISDAGGDLMNRARRRGAERYGAVVDAGNLETFLQTLNQQPGVYTIEPGGGARLLNDNASAIVQSGSASGTRSIWHRGIHGEGQVVAVLDTGLDYDSCYFADDPLTTPPLVRGTAAGSPDLSARKVIVYDFLYSGDFAAGPEDFDNQGHGTLVSGNATGARFDNPFGSTVYNGMAPAARLIMQDGGYIGLDACSDLAALGCPVIDLTPFLDQAVMQGAHIHNNSWGDREDFFPQNTYTAPTSDMDDVTWRNPEFLITCAAGNQGTQGIDSVGSPSVAKNVLSVGATQSPSFGLSGDPERITFFSSLGWAADGRIKPDLTAPGQTRTSASDGDIQTGNCEFVFVQGTSMASPVVAGCAALVRQYFTEGWYPSGQRTPADAFTPTAALIKATLLNGTVDMTQTDTPPPNRHEGWGRIHLENSLYFAGDTRRVVALDSRDAFTTATLDPVVLRIRAAGNSAAGLLKITLVWTDPPASPAASTALVNDLDLRVTDIASSTTYWGNHFDFSPSNDGFTRPGGTPDRINNVEMVILPAATSGTFEVRVEPTSLVQIPQGLALVIGGDVSIDDLMNVNRGWMLY